MKASNHSPMDPLIEGYLSYLDKVGRKTPRTIIDVRCTLRGAVSELRPDIPLWHLKLEDYLHWLEAKRRTGCTETSLAKYLSHLRGFLNYAWRSGRNERNVLDGFTLKHALPRTEPSSLTLDEAEKLVRATSATGPTARRDRLVVLLLYGCGLRTDELCGLDVAEINRERHELVVLRAKGDRPRSIPIPEALYTELLAYLLEHGKRGPLFRTSTKHRRLRASDVCTIVKDTVIRAGLRPDITPRTLRHYLPFLTMSGDMEWSDDRSIVTAPQRKSSRSSPEIVFSVFSALQTIKEAKQSVSRLVAPRSAVRR